MRERGYKKLLQYLFTFFLLMSVLLFIGKSNASDDLQQIKKELENGDWQARLAAVEKLRNRNDEQTVDLLMQVAGTRNEYWPIQIKAIQFLGETANPKTLTLLLSIFNDTFLNWECPSIKSYTALALAHFKNDEKVFEALVKGIHDGELLTREASIQALGKIGNARAVPHLTDVLHDKNVAVRLSAIGALEQIGDPLAIPPLQYIAEHDSEVSVKNRARIALKNFH